MWPREDDLLILKIVWIIKMCVRIRTIKTKETKRWAQTQHQTLKALMENNKTNFLWFLFEQNFINEKTWNLMFSVFTHLSNNERPPLDPGRRHESATSNRVHLRGISCEASNSRLAESRRWGARTGAACECWVVWVVELDQVKRERQWRRLETMSELKAPRCWATEQLRDVSKSGRTSRCDFQNSGCLASLTFSAVPENKHTSESHLMLFVYS